MFALLTSLAFGAAPCFDFVQLDVPNPAGGTYADTSWWGLNNRDQYVGNYCVDDACEETYAVLYDARAGTWTSFHVPGFAYRTVGRINDGGQVAGYGVDDAGNPRSFVRSAAGSMTYLDHVPGFLPMDINNRGEVVGFVTEGGIGSYLFHGAILSGPRRQKVTYYEIDGADWSAIWGSNDVGDLLPTWENTDSPPWYIVGYDVGDGFEAMDLAGWDAATAWNMNNRGVIVGSLLDADTWLHPGFFRTVDGEMHEVWYGDPADETWTAVLDINDAGVIVGTHDDYGHGFIGYPRACE